MEEVERIVYEAHNLYEMQENHIKLFENKKNFADTLVANKIREYVSVTKRNGLQMIAKKLRSYKSFGKNAFNAMGIETKIAVRTKDYIGFLKKTILYVMTDKPLAKLMDIHGARWTIGNQEKDDEMSHNLCDLMANMSLLYLASHGWIILEAEPTIETNFDKEKYPGIHITKRHLIFENFDNNVKDYKKRIKENGYQRVHLYVKAPEGTVIEIQIGTFAMDQIFDDKEHDGYKDSKYKEVNLTIDPANIKAEGFVLDENGKIKEDPEGILISSNLKLE